MQSPSEESFRRHRLAVAGVLAIAASLLPVPGSAALQAWDQARVTELAQQLAEGVKDARLAFRRELPASGAARVSQARTQQEYAEVLRGLQTSTRQLATRLAAGEGLEQTLPIALKIRSLLRDGERLGARIMTTAQMMERYLPVEKILDEIGPFYFDPEQAAEAAPEAGGGAAPEASGGD